MPAAVVGASTTVPVVAMVVAMVAAEAAFGMRNGAVVRSRGFWCEGDHEADDSSQDDGWYNDGEQFFHGSMAGCSRGIRRLRENNIHPFENNLRVWHLCGHSNETANPALKPYPLETCLVSGEKLGGIGKPIAFEYKGQEIKICCKACRKKFDKDPATYLKKLEPRK